MSNNSGVHGPISKTIPYLLYLYAFTSCISIAGTNAVLALLAFIFLVDWWKTKSIGNVRKDFSLFAAIYGWKGITLIVNAMAVKVYRVRELWDKIPYLVIGKYRISDYDLLKTLHVLFITNSLLIIYAFLQRFFNVDYIFKPLFYGNRMEGYFGNALHYGGYISIVLLLCLSLSLFYRIDFLLYLPFLIAGLIISESRSYYIGSVVAVLVLAYFKSRRALASTLALIPVILIIGATVFPGFSERLSSIFKASSWQVRLDYWPVAWEIYKESPVFGVGYNEFSNRLKPLEEAGVIGNASHAHNLYLQELVEGGPVGLLLITFVMVWFVRKYYLLSRRNNDRLFSAMSMGLSLSFLTLMIAGMGEYNFGAAVVWLLLTFLMGICEAYRNGLNPTHGDLSTKSFP